MNTVDPVYQQTPDAQQYPDGGVFVPALDMSAIAQGAPGMNPYGMLPEAHWGQWWSPSDTVSAESANVMAPVLFDPEQYFFHNNPTLDREAVTQWDSPSTSVHSYPQFSPATEATSVDVSPGKSRRGSAATQTDQRRQKRSTTTEAKTKPQPSTTRRAPKKKTPNAEPETTAVPEKPKRGRRPKVTAKPSPKPTRKAAYDEDESEDAEADPEEQYDTHIRKIQERNRIASNKFRVRKRQDANKLRIDEEDMERANRDLSDCVSELTLQVYDLKMKLLQHTDCDCALIKDYIATEAQRYVKDLCDGKHPNATPALPPPAPYQQHMHHSHRTQ
ncbi:transcription factor [Fusarium langsethiae]|uniref:Transcription factor n=1 Tax=Fusarium langsethiae TaxID=179993 RepID=A0A0N0V5Y1_FUSLA|nr:transcription factor [Fusarium langsethiae]GKU06619.1 unnamed protein product [Fusarium langsethiae]GKU08977.1 unnamed protein product [Fusarium langsethiae]